MLKVTKIHTILRDIQGAVWKNSLSYYSNRYSRSGVEKFTRGALFAPSSFLDRVKQINEFVKVNVSM